MIRLVGICSPTRGHGTGCRLGSRTIQALRQSPRRCAACVVRRGREPFVAWGEEPSLPGRATVTIEGRGGKASPPAGVTRRKSAASWVRLEYRLQPMASAAQRHTLKRGLQRGRRCLPQGRLDAQSVGDDHFAVTASLAPRAFRSARACPSGLPLTNTASAAFFSLNDWAMDSML